MPPMPLTGPKRCPFGQSTLMPKVMQERAKRELVCSFLTVAGLSAPLVSAEVRDPRFVMEKSSFKAATPVAPSIRMALPIRGPNPVS